MVGLAFLTPSAALVGLVALVPLVALAAGVRRASRAAEAVGLEPVRTRWPLAAAALVALGALVAAAAAQPVVESEETRSVRQDAEAFFVLDTSRSMQAASAPGGETRFERARTVARQLRDELGDVPAGVASLTDRVLPHLFPTASRQTFASTVERALEVGRPPAQERSNTRSTTLEAVVTVSRARFFSPQARRRLIVVVSDAETRPFDVESTARLFDRTRYLLVLLRVGGNGERVWLGGRAEPYRPDPGSHEITDRFVRSAGGAVFDETDVAAAAVAAREFLGEGPKVDQGREPHAASVAPWVLAAGILPLGLLLWRRPL